MHFGRDWVSLGGPRSPCPPAARPQAGATRGVAWGSCRKGGQQGQAQGTLPGWTAWFFFETQTEEKRHCEQRRAGRDPLAAAVGEQPGGPAASDSGERGGRAPPNAGSGQGTLLRLIPFWGTGDTTSKRSPANASQPLPLHPSPFLSRDGQPGSAPGHAGAREGGQAAWHS